MGGGDWVTCSQCLSNLKMSPIGPVLPPELLVRPRPPQAREEEEGYPEKEEEEEEEDDYAPALPPDLLASRSNARNPSSTNKLVGPSMPPDTYAFSRPQIRSGHYGEEDSSDDDVGPKPLPSGVSFDEADGVSEFMEKEERRRKQVEVGFYSVFRSPYPIYSRLLFIFLFQLTFVNV